MVTRSVENQEAALQAAANLARTCDFDEVHTNQVTRLSLRLFDELESLHKFGATERYWLKCAALLHDIGWIEGRKQHHKASLRIILDTPLLPFDSKERLIIGSIARYHRKALPSLEHDHYAALSPEEQDAVLKLSALLRMADGLDSAHRGDVRHLSALIKPKKVVLECAVPQPSKEDSKSALEKSDLFQMVFDKKVELTWAPVE